MEDKLETNGEKLQRYVKMIQDQTLEEIQKSGKELKSMLLNTGGQGSVDLLVNQTIQNAKFIVFMAEMMTNIEIMNARIDLLTQKIDELTNKTT
jgi:hypothetical protein